MRLRNLRKTTLLSLLGISSTSAQTTSSWGEPFSVQGPTSTENLIPASSVLASSAASIAESHISSAASSVASEASPSAPLSTATLAQSISSDSTFTVTLPSTTQSGLTVSSPIVTGSRNSTAGAGTGTSAGPTPTTLAQVPDSNGSTGAASVPTPYVKMRVVGVIAGAAGVFMA